MLRAAARSSTDSMRAPLWATGLGAIKSVPVHHTTSAIGCAVEVLLWTRRVSYSLRRGVTAPLCDVEFQ